MKTLAYRERIKKIISIPLVIFTLCPFLLSAEEIVKWVDEKGKVHFGSRAPAEYKDKAEQVDVSNQNVVENENREKNARVAKRIEKENDARAKEKEKPAQTPTYHRPKDDKAENDMRIGGCDAAPSLAIRAKCLKNKSH